MRELPEFASALDVRQGKDPHLDAWVLHFMTENGLEHAVEPLENASPEQVRFMVALDEDQVFAPCSDWMFHALLHQRRSPQLLQHYFKIWRLVRKLCRDHVQDDYVRRKIMALCRRKFRSAVSEPILIPSRLVKRLLTIVLALSGLDDPWRERKRAMNARMAAFLAGPELRGYLGQCPTSILGCQTIPEMRFRLDMTELRRLFHLSLWSDVWDSKLDDGGAPDLARLLEESAQPSEGFERLDAALARQTEGGLKILYLPNSAGGVLVDLLIVRSLLRLGHRVVLALKEGFFFQAPALWDFDRDPVLASALAGAHFVTEPRLSKNELLKTLRENPFVVISDGTREQLNLYRTSVTFARAWKEADLVIAKGEYNYRRLIQTSHSFTRDVFALFRSQVSGLPHVHFKARPERIKVFSESDISRKADAIIAGLRAARAAGKKVMFYSAIIGSIPGQTKVAVQVVTTFVNWLRSRLDGTHVINPAEVFEEGMDGDDLMFMWEKVQRSGLIDVWRFQTDADIEKSFELMGQKVPPVWAGKDATYSTGCTKEMKIALDVQDRYREMQIIGPAAEKFFRRREYGVGKYCDAGIECDA